MAKWSDEKMADLTRRLADTAIDYKTRCEVLEERWEAACQDAREAEAHAEELEAKLAKLTKAADRVHDSYWNNTDGIIVGMYDLGEALRAAKETPHD